MHLRHTVTQQLTGGVTSFVAGHLVSFGADGKLQHFGSVGYVVVASTVLAVCMAWNVNRGVQLRALA